MDENKKEKIILKNKLTMFGGRIRINPAGIICLILVVLFIFYFMRGGNDNKNLKLKDGNKNISLKSLLSVSIEIAKRGGAEVKRIREMADIGEKSKGKTQEGANNPVTDGDMLSHRAMYYGILKAFPDVDVVSEESDPQPIDMNEIKMPSLHNEEVEDIVTSDTLVPIEDVDVWIDPLDATQEYTENLRQYVTTMVCIAVKGKPVVGVIYKPFEDLTAWAWAGPNYMNKVVAKDVANNLKNQNKDLSQSKIIVSRSHAGDVHKVAENAFGDKIEVTPAGGAGFKAWEVVKGTQDAYIHVTLIKKWDICPGNAILKALGGKLTTLNGSEIDYSDKDEKNRGGVVATMHDHDAFVEKFKGSLKTRSKK